eukprot:4674538-Prymnesium_polylepis.2
MIQRPRGKAVDLLLVPLSSGGAKCRHTDYVSRSMYAGEHWEINTRPLKTTDADAVSAAARESTTLVPRVLVDEEPPRAAHAHEDESGELDGVRQHVSRTVVWPLLRRINTEMVVPVPRRASGCAFPPAAYVLYMLSVHSNAYQMYAAGLDSYKSGMTQAFAAAFPDASTCDSQYPTVEPSYGSELCFMGSYLTPYDEASDPMELSYSAVYVPASQLTAVASWAMDNRVAGKRWYDVDLRLVPLTGCSKDDFIENALKAGDTGLTGRHNQVLGCRAAARSLQTLDVPPRETVRVPRTGRAICSNIVSKRGNKNDRVVRKKKTQANGRPRRAARLVWIRDPIGLSRDARAPSPRPVARGRGPCDVVVVARHR